MSTEPLTEAELTNLRTACFTSTMRSDPAWAAALDALARKVDELRTREEQIEAMMTNSGYTRHAAEYELATRQSP